ncbi:RagB/SusD family nutrient uptake outer membrane protein [Cellulophaga omnivescoria]|uniref:RagB/SusD family nutrient uptake outer membrane protein n=1 Tax=Cellulophaga omnivescoria TaxID=1888890 RepID=UPI0015595E90|nr:RagB/SusD family nutrient uptake outer membrane protein [Cellulophaga omnivescoria]
MKNIKIVLIVLVTFNITSCEKDFLEEPQSTGLPPTVIFKSVEGMEAHVSGMVRWLRIGGSVDAASLNSIYYARSVKGNDIINRQTFFQYDYDHIYRNDPTWRRTTFTWSRLYILIDEANVFIEGAENSNSVPDVSKNPLIAQAKAMRALAYFELALEYQHTYAYDPSLPAPPLYTEPSVNTGPIGMSTIQEIYDFIIEDLTFAVNNLTEDRISKSYVNVNVANGILARVYQTMNNWTGAEEAANKAYGGVPSNALFPGEYNNGFDDITESNEWMWGAIQTEDQNQGWAGAPHVISDHRVLSYYGTFINNDFVDLFTDTDVRKLFRNHYNAAETSYRHWVTDKFDFAFDADIPYMRTPEMILIEAEAKYHNGDTAGAHNLLYALQSNRDVNAIKSSNTGQALLDEILVERRKELYAEFGVEWFDAKRYRKGITRTGNHRVFLDLEPDDVKFILKIPQDEIDANEFIDPNVNLGR